MRKQLEKLMNRRDLSARETEALFELLMTGEMTQAQTAAVMVALRMKGETAGEIAGAAAAMRRHALLIDAGGVPVVDTCGTGGDGLNTFNVSTTAAFVAAGAGVAVAKHGNRAVSSGCGSADVLEALGVNIEAPPERVEECLHSAGIAFLFAPRLHPAMKHAMGPRRELGVRTIFNILGPLTNPAGAMGQALGVFSAELTETMAEALRALGSRRALVVHGADGMDEITVTTTTRITELKNNALRTYEFDPLPFIGDYRRLESLSGGRADENAVITRSILYNEDKGARKDITLLNAAAAIMAGEKADSFGDALDAARLSLESGKAARALERLVEASK